MKTGFRSQIIQTGSLKRLSQERRQMCLWSLEQDLTLLAARGVLEKLNGYMDRKDQATFYPVAFESVSIRGKPMPYLMKAIRF